MSRTFTARNSSQEFTRYKANGLGRMYSRRYPIKIAPRSLMYEAGDLWTEITSTSPTFGALMQLHPCLHKPLRGVKQDTLQSLEPKAYRSHAQKMQWPWLPDMISSSQWNTITYHYIYIYHSISAYMLLHGVSVKTCIGFAAMRWHKLSYNQQLARQTCPRAWDRLRRTTLMAYLKQNVKKMVSSFKLHSPEILHQPVPKWGFLS